jgi:aminomethyltransferase
LWRILLEEVDLPTANILKSLLEESGIEVLIKPGSFDPVIFGQGGLVQILVTEEDFEKAQKILREASKNEENTSI